MADQGSASSGSLRPIEVLIAGGGVGALELAFALRAMAAERVNLTLLSPDADFVYRPMAVLEPFAGKPPRRLPLKDVAAELNARLEQDALVAVDPERRVVKTRSERELPYDALVVAVGARAAEPLEGTIAMNPARMDERLHQLIEEIDRGAIHSLGFVAPRPAWPLPVYELALLAKERARARDHALGVSIVTEEREPLALFGTEVSAAVGGLLSESEIELISGAHVDSRGGKLVALPDDRELGCERLVSAPRLLGPAIEGLPADGDGFVPIDDHCRVRETEHVYAIGDATDFPIKWGGMAAQHGDAAAASIAAQVGAAVEPAPFDRTVHGVLIGGRAGQKLFFSARLEQDGARESRVSDAPTWSPEAKVAARYLGPYLDQLWATGPRWLAGQLSWEATLSRLESDFAPTS